MKKKFRNLKICFLAFAVIGVVFSACKKDDDNGPGNEQDLVAVWEISQHIYISKENGKIVDNDTTKGGRIVLNDDKTAVFDGSDKYKWEYSGGKLKLNYTGKIEDEDEREDYNEEFDMLELTGNKMVMECNIKEEYKGDVYEDYEKYTCTKKSSNQVSDLVGTWICSESHNVEGESYEFNQTYVFNADGTFKYTMHEVLNGSVSDAADQGTYTYINGKLSVKGDKVTFSEDVLLEGNKLTVGESVFTRK